MTETPWPAADIRYVKNSLLVFFFENLFLLAVFEILYENYWKRLQKAWRLLSFETFKNRYESCTV